MWLWLTFSALLRKTCMPFQTHLKNQSLISTSYLVTELMEIDLESFLRSKPILGEFVQYFLYQIMVRPLPTPIFRC